MNTLDNLNNGLKEEIKNLKNRLNIISEKEKQLESDNKTLKLTITKMNIKNSQINNKFQLNQKKLREKETENSVLKADMIKIKTDKLNNSNISYLIEDTTITDRLQNKDLLRKQTPNQNRTNIVKRKQLNLSVGTASKH